MDFSPLRVLRCKSLAQSSNDYGVVALQQIGPLDFRIGSFRDLWVRPNVRFAQKPATLTVGRDSEFDNVGRRGLVIDLN